MQKRMNEKHQRQHGLLQSAVWERGGFDIYNNCSNRINGLVVCCGIHPTVHNTHIHLFRIITVYPPTVLQFPFISQSYPQRERNCELFLYLISTCKITSLHELIIYELPFPSPFLQSKRFTRFTLLTCISQLKVDVAFHGGRDLVQVFITRC